MQNNGKESKFLECEQMCFPLNMVIQGLFFWKISMFPHIRLKNYSMKTSGALQGPRLVQLLNM